MNFRDKNLEMSFEQIALLTGMKISKTKIDSPMSYST